MGQGAWRTLFVSRPSPVLMRIPSLATDRPRRRRKPRGARGKRRWTASDWLSVLAVTPLISLALAAGWGMVEYVPIPAAPDSLTSPSPAVALRTTPHEESKEEADRGPTFPGDPDSTSASDTIELSEDSP